ncbi:hypothetical protein ACFYWY_00880 [Streptomyces sp. NPDC002870]|uniref:hypothetical protein n=1 Tax=Streptomyces sp. NPDC002870 TaxID=3364666 RepID=UPI00369B244A
MQQSTSIGTYQSRFATYARSLNPSLLSTLRIDEATILAAEVAVSICKLLTDSDNSQPWMERIEKYFEDADTSALEEGFEGMVKDFQDGKSKIWVEKYKNDGYRDFALRLLGAARYRLLIQALKEDVAVAALALRRIVRGAMPFAVAWSDSVGTLTKDQLKAKSKADFAALNVVHLVISLDGLLGEKVLAKLPMEVTAATNSDVTAWKMEGAADLVSQFRSLVAEASAKRVERANSPLIRKIKGARAALTYSEDGTSQAANSLIELIDRIMGEAYPPHAVLEWVDANLPNEPELTHFDKDQKRKPTKYGEALCFVYGGGSVLRPATEHDESEGPSLIHEMIARAVVSTRNRLQKIKHADTGSPEEREQLLTLFTALEGALMLGLSIGKASAPFELPAV